VGFNLLALVSLRMRSWDWCTRHNGGVPKGAHQQRMPGAQQRRRTVAEQRREVRPAALRLLQPQRLDRGGIAGGCCRPVPCKRRQVVQLECRKSVWGVQA
jgi:hypothetical protein